MDSGFGWAPGNNAAICEQGFYNPGRNQRRCTRCPGGLTTAAEGAVHLMECGAPPGYMYVVGKAMACAKGTYKSEIGNTDCTQCPQGITTATVACESPSSCSYIMAGYAIKADAVLGLTAASPCPADTYRSEEHQFDGTTAVICTPCPGGSRTMSEGSTSQDSCMAPPGYGYDLATGTSAICPSGTYNTGWNRDPCTDCGKGSFTTDGEGSISPDACKILAGYGSSRSADGLMLTAFECPVGMFGREADTYGLVEVACTPCPEFSTTNSTGSVGIMQCLAEPGYGWEDGSVRECYYGEYSAGWHHDPCTACGDGYNTSKGGSYSEATMGATSKADCIVAAGWTPDGAGGLKPCVPGYYKALMGPSACVKCPDGTTSTMVNAASQISDCDACRPGFGTGSSGVLNASSPWCAVCESGTYAPGNVRGGEVCQPCPHPAEFTGRMVSRRGISTPEYCLPEFTSDGLDNFETWDMLTMSTAALTSASGISTVESCQQACSSSDDCQYFVFHHSSGVCSVRDKVPYQPVDVTDMSKSYVLFAVYQDQYVAYPAHETDGASLGEPLAIYTTREEAKTACDVAEACVGIKYIHTEAESPWRTFRGTLWEGVTGKIKVNGESVNPWIQEPRAN